MTLRRFIHYRKYTTSCSRGCGFRRHCGLTKACITEACMEFEIQETETHTRQSTSIVVYSTLVVRRHTAFPLLKCALMRYILSSLQVSYPSHAEYILSVTHIPSD